MTFSGLARTIIRTSPGSAFGGFWPRYLRESSFGSHLASSTARSAVSRISTESYGFARSKIETLTRGSSVRFRTV
jgi:hypothetical protein